MGSDKSVILVLANHDFQDSEYNEIVDGLKNAGIDVVITAAINEECKGLNGTEVSVALEFGEVDITQHDGIVLIGGTGIEGYLHDESVHSLVQGMNKYGKVIGAISWAPAILANAGILKGKRATAWQGAIKDFIAAGAGCTGEPITIDGNIVTANGSDMAGKFVQEVAKLING